MWAKGNCMLWCPHSSSHLASSQDYIDIVDSEDEELERAIHESIREFEQKKTSPVKNTSSLEDIIRNFQEKAVDNTKTELIIFRRKVLESAFRGIQRPTFKLNSRIYVKFSGEIGQDHGGPRREFFSFEFFAWVPSFVFLYHLSYMHLLSCAIFRLPESLR